MNDLINQLSQESGLSPDKVQIFVDIVVKHIKSKGPASVTGQIDDVLMGRGQSVEKKSA